MSQANVTKIVEAAERHPWLVQHWAPLLGALFVMGMLLYAFERSLPMTVSNPVVIGTAQPGSTVRVEWQQQWAKLCPASVTRVIEGAHGETSVLRPFDIDPPARLGPQTRLATVYIPKTIGAGPATLRSTIRFHCNTFQELWPITVRTPPVTIMVIEPPAIVIPLLPPA